MGDIVGDRASSDFRVVRSPITVRSALADSGGASWLVIVDPDGQPVKVASREVLERTAPDASLETVMRRGAPLVVVDSNTPVPVAVASPAFGEVHPDTAVLVVRGDEVEGIWAGADLAGAFLSHGVRGLSDFDLPGRIAIPKIVVQCGYSEGSTTCLDRRSFAERPDVMPECDNPKHLSAHAVVW
ncbi:MAG: hypothetical protein ACLGI2_01075 [Acidimicrobiia bacterium]